MFFLGSIQRKSINANRVSIAAHARVNMCRPDHPEQPALADIADARTRKAIADAPATLALANEPHVLGAGNAVDVALQMIEAPAAAFALKSNQTA